MNQIFRSYLGKTALAVVGVAVLVTSAAFAQVTAPEAYANDGARQTAAGGWVIPYDECRLDMAELSGLNETACLAAGWNWDPQALTGSNCYYNRPECLARIDFGVNLSGGTNIDNSLFDTSPECIAAGRDWREDITPPIEPNKTGACSDGESRDQTACEANTPDHPAAQWYSPACRGLFTWDAGYGFVSSGAGQYAECSKCHNDRHYPKNKPGTHYHGSERSVGETYVMTGHKNMVRPAAPVGNTDPHYIAGTPWLNKTGVEVDVDASGNPIDWLTGQITVGGVPKQLFWIYDWIAAAPRSAYDGVSYSCARCHTTGYEAAAADETIKQPYVMFNDADPGSGTLTGSFDQFGIMCSRCHGSRPYSATSGNRHHPTDIATGSKATAVCMDCHRQETGGAPYDATNPGTVLKVGNAHSSIDFVSHAGANEFLNSPHGRFSGTFAQINDPTFYDTHFKNEGEPYPFSGNEGGCVQCHDVHKSTLPEANPNGGAIHEECTECHAKDMNTILHPAGPGTPLEEMEINENTACESCHMPGSKHLFRVSSDAAYSTFPAAAFTAGLANANTTVDDGFNAVWVDVDMACGQCHGGGTEYKLTAGDIPYNTDQLTLDDATGFAVGGRIQIAGAGAAGADLLGYVKAVVGNVVTLAGGAKAGTGVTDAEVILNPTKNLAGYMTKIGLAELAAGIHNDKPIVTFGYTLTPTNTLQVNVNASFSSCSGSIANCDAFVWNWGDGTPDTNAATPTASHTYATGGTKLVTLTVEEYGVNEASKSKNIRVFAADAPPVAGGTACDSIIDLNTWAASLTDNSTDGNGVKQVTVNWGDGGAISSAIDTTAPYSLIGTVFTRTYLNAASLTIKQTAYDTIGQANVRTCPPVTLSTFSLSGNARRLNDAPVSGAKVTIKKGALTVRTVYTNALGDYTVGNLKPATYNVTATKVGLTFAQVYNQPVGPSASGLNFQSAQ